MSPRKRLAVVDDSSEEELADSAVPSTSRPRLGRLRRAADVQDAQGDSEVIDLSGDGPPATASAAATAPPVLPTPVRRRPAARPPLDSPQGAAPPVEQTPPRSSSRAGRAKGAAAARESALQLLRDGQNPLLRLDGASWQHIGASVRCQQWPAGRVRGLRTSRLSTPAVLTCISHLPLPLPPRRFK